MSGLPEKLRLKGRAEEDIYFARRDRELIAALQRRRLAGLAPDKAPSRRPDSARTDRSRPAPARTGTRQPSRRTGAFYRRLLERARRLLRGVG
ncbi:MAG: hypothetical protein QNJ91_16355 [Gammaproteobacteria bacterium]|nr:hypothetical protein [Gammaproteobacteria bacterium]